MYCLVLSRLLGIILITHSYLLCPWECRTFFSLCVYLGDVCGASCVSSDGVRRLWIYHQIGKRYRCSLQGRERTARGKNNFQIGSATLMTPSPRAVGDAFLQPSVAAKLQLYKEEASGLRWTNCLIPVKLPSESSLKNS